MKKYYLIAITICVSIGVLSFINIEKSSPYTTVIPPNAQGTGTRVPAALFNSWFVSGVPTLNGIVKPADGLAFPNIPNISFYQWTEQMYLWITSPTPRSYGCNGIVLTSPEFFDVSATDPITGLRTLTRHSCSTIVSVPIDTPSGKVQQINVGDAMTFDVKGAAKGANNLPVIFEKGTHKMFDVDQAPKSKGGKQLIFNDKREKVEIDDVKMVKGKPVFYDINGKVILSPKPIITQGLNLDTTVQQFFNKDLVVMAIITGSGIVISVPDQGQATGDVLMAQNGSLVYYNSMVNDIYAVFLTMIKNGVLPNTAKFPTTAAELATIQAYATLKSIPILEPSALAMELKTSWVETTNIANVATEYFTVTAVVPKYVLTSANVWTRSGTRKATLALVGMHIVGSTDGHPEMLWGSIEHKNNTPNVSYSYTNTGGGTTTIAADTNAPVWLFADTSFTNATSFNISHMFMNGNDINSIFPFAISASNTRRTAPYGALPTNSGSNAEIISTNTDVINQLIGTDLRKKYYHIGTTWKAFGTAFEAGTTQLSNSTLETYSQVGNVNGDPRTNCFGCHTSTTGNPNQNMPQLTNLSHIFNSKPIVP
jgi:hypothetical protein